jgi:hypothetical protein
VGRVVDLGGVTLRPTSYQREQWRKQLEETGFEVTIHPGRGVVLHPDDDFWVEFEFTWDPRGPKVAVTRASIEGELPEEIDLRPYSEALVLKLISEPVATNLRVPKRRPKPGQPPDKEFYKRVLELHNLLVRQNEKRPSAALARLMGESSEQVRLWVHRATRYLDQEEQS